MTKYLLTKPGGPWDFPALGFSAVDGAILDGDLPVAGTFTSAPGPEWSTTTGAESGINRYAPPSTVVTYSPIPVPQGLVDSVGASLLTPGSAAQVALSAAYAAQLTTRSVTASTTSAAQEFVEADATAGVVTVTGPNGAAAKRWGVKKINGTGTAPGNKVTISYLNAAGTATALDLTLPGESKIFRPAGSGYRVESGDTPKTGLDYLYAKPGLLNRSTVVLWGDSHSQYGGGGFGASGFTGSNPITRSRGYWSWASSRLGGRMTLVNNAGVAGQRTGAILTRWATDVAPYTPGWVVVTAGTNNVNFDIASTSDVAGVVATVQADIISMIGLIRSSGGNAVICTLPPVNAFTAAQNSARDQINRWIKALATTGAGNVMVCDWNPLISAYSATLPQWRAGASFDGTHGGAIGCARMGYALAQVLDPLVPKTDMLPGYQDTLTLLANAMQTGATGALTTGLTGQVATSYATGNDGGAITAVGSKVARTDGIIGEWQQYVISGGTGLRHFQNIATGYTPGAKYGGLLEFQADADLDMTKLSDYYAELVAFAPSGNATSYSRKNADSDSFNDPYCRIPSGAFVIPSLQLPADVTSLRLQVHIDGASGFAGTVRLGRADLVAA